MKSGGRCAAVCVACDFCLLKDTVGVEVSYDNNLVVRKKIDFREGIAAFLVSEGYCVLEAWNVAEVEPLMAAFDIAIIDVDLPDNDGMKAAVRLRTARPKCGIVMLSARGNVKDKIASLSEAVNLYLTKLINFTELRAYLIALKRRIGTRWQLQCYRGRLLSPDGYAERLNE